MKNTQRNTQVLASELIYLHSRLQVLQTCLIFHPPPNQNLEEFVECFYVHCLSSGFFPSK